LQGKVRQHAQSSGKKTMKRKFETNQEGSGKKTQTNVAVRELMEKKKDKEVKERLGHKKKKKQAEKHTQRKNRPYLTSKRTQAKRGPTTEGAKHGKSVADGRFWEKGPRPATGKRVKTNKKKGSKTPNQPKKKVANKSGGRERTRPGNGPGGGNNWGQVKSGARVKKSKET